LQGDFGFYGPVTTSGLEAPKMMYDDRLVDIESKIAFQEDLLQELNKTIYEQQKKIARLEAICNSLIDHVKELSEAAAEGGVINERPPHY